MKRLSVEKFVIELLESAGCKGIKAHKDSVTAQCPFHWNKNNFQTFRVSTQEIINKRTGESGYWFNCFSCKKGGSLPILIAHIQKCSIKKALKIFEKRVVKSRIRIESLLLEWQEFNKSTVGELDEIELPEPAINQEPMVNYLLERNKQAHNLIDIEYVVNKYELYYCNAGRMAGRIIMPIKDETGYVVGFNDRSIDRKASVKSLHPKGCPYGRMLHGYYENAHKKFCIITEGAFDMFVVDSVINCKKAMRGLYGVVNLMGTAFTDERIQMIIQSFEKAYLMFDYDDAGVKLLNNVKPILAEEIAVYDSTRSYPEHKDPAICTDKEIIRAIKKPYVEKQKRSYLDFIQEKFDFTV